MKILSYRFVGAESSETLTKIHEECFPRYWDRNAFTDFFAVKNTFAVLVEEICDNFVIPAQAWILSPENNKDSRLRGNDNRGDGARKTPVGMMVYRIAFDQADLLTVAVRSAFRKAGIAKKLVADSMSHCAELGAKKLFLEVEVGNDPAIKLYETQGFKHISRRKLYYKQLDGSLTDALVMSKKL